jgi:hypothetical protein
MTRMEPPRCARCNESMHVGVLIDHGHGHVRRQPEWLAGPPESSWWGSLKRKGKESHHVITYRCPRCGRLESYAEGVA